MPQNHFDEETLERYALGQLAGADLAAAEEHLLLCQHCRDRLAELDQFIAAFRGAVRGFAQHPIDYTHATELGPVRLHTSENGSQWAALISGATIEYGKVSAGLYEANSFLVRAFGELFPEHRCTDECGPTREPA